MTYEELRTLALDKAPTMTRQEFYRSLPSGFGWKTISRLEAEGVVFRQLSEQENADIEWLERDKQRAVDACGPNALRIVTRRERDEDGIFAPLSRENRPDWEAEIPIDQYGNVLDGEEHE